jgi:topoisomerase IA-like protein
MIKNQCKPILLEKGRYDLYAFVRKEIIDLEGMEEVEEVTAQMVVDNLIARYPENTYTPPPKKTATTPAGKKYAQELKIHHGLS